MVKNISGGSKTKNIARKFVSDGRTDKLVLSTCADERYAVVTHIYGGDRCAVVTDNGLVLQAIIRKKFRGRHRRNNLIAVGSYVLVGLREFEAPVYKVCDVLEVYSKDEHDRLNNTPSVDTALLNGIANGIANGVSGASGASGATLGASSGGLADDIAFSNAASHAAEADSHGGADARAGSYAWAENTDASSNARRALEFNIDDI